MSHIKKNPPSHRITHWLERLEWQTEALLEDIVLDNLSTKDRLTLAVQYLQQMQRFLQLSQQIEVNTRNTEEQAVIESMKAWMRGEPNSLPDTFFTARGGTKKEREGEVTCGTEIA